MCNLLTTERQRKYLLRNFETQHSRRQDPAKIPYLGRRIRDNDDKNSSI